VRAIAPVDKLSLVPVAVFATILLDERSTFRQWLGILLVGSGIVMLGFKK
jgi:transporter family protein